MLISLISRTGRYFVYHFVTLHFTWRAIWRHYFIIPLRAPDMSLLYFHTGFTMPCQYISFDDTLLITCHAGDAIRCCAITIADASLHRCRFKTFTFLPLLPDIIYMLSTLCHDIL